METGRRKAFILVSVGSPLFSQEWLKAFFAAASKEYAVTFVLMDKPEQYNLEVFKGLNETNASLAAEATTYELIAKLGLVNYDSDLWRWSDIEKLPHYFKYRKAIRYCYDSSSAFKRHCRNQVFSNLRPQMRSADIRRKTDPRLEELVPYLIEEIAAKFCLVQESIFDSELLPRKEMDIVTAIYSNKYPELNTIVRRSPKFRKLSNSVIAADYWDTFSSESA